ncbi:MAG: C4-dicarboxylic acid transporter DauA [Myxococcota bacterium]
MSRYQNPLAMLPRLGLRPAAALREVLAGGYGRKDFVADVLAGIVVGVVALPLAMALAINSGVAPQHGIYTAIVAGAVVALLGGSRAQVTGPTAAFIVILAPIASQYGLGGLMLATVMAGFFLVAMGLLRLGRLIQFIPHPVTTGFTSGIAVVIAATQVDKLLGLPGKFSDHFIPRAKELALALPQTHLQDLGIGVLTLALLLLWPKVTKKVPSPVVALTVGGLVAVLLAKLTGLEVATINSKFSWMVGGASGRGIPPLPPQFVLPWTQPGPDGAPVELSYDLVRALLPSAAAIAMLGAIESLLCAVVADGMMGTKHDPDAELVAQGFGNLVAPFFGGIAATGAIARTATNIRAGAKSPIASITHALFVLVGVVLLAPLLGHLPMASMAALLLLTAWNMSEARHFVHILKVAPRSDVAVLLTVFALTVAMDMVVSVSVGVMLAALLFMRRMADVAGAERLEGPATEHAALPEGTIWYEIRGPLFFGAAEKAIGALAASANSGKRTFLLVLDDVPAMDVTGLVALESAIGRIHSGGGFVVLAGVQPQPMQVLEKAGLHQQKGKLAVFSSVDDAVAFVRERAEAK